MATISVPIGKAMEGVNLDVRVTGVGVLRFRLWLAALLVRLAGIVSGGNVIVEWSDEFDQLPPLPRYRSYMMVGDVEVPRQASVRYNSPLYVSNTHEWGRKVDFFLDGERIDDIISYDLDAGYVRTYKFGADGEKFIAGDELATEIHHGRLEVRPAETV